MILAEIPIMISVIISIVLVLSFILFMQLLITGCCFKPCAKIPHARKHAERVIFEDFGKR